MEVVLADNNWPWGSLLLSYIHPTMGHTVDSDAVRFNPVEVRLIMDGVNEDNEEFPGNYILYNKDDDDNDGVPDYDDGYDKDGIPGNEDDENIYEDDLVLIGLSSVQPVWYLTGTVTFDVTSGASKVKVWKAHPFYPTVKEIKDIEISLPETYNTPADLPKVFYVEGIEPSDGPRDVEFKLTYTKAGLTFEDKIKVTVVHVELFRDAGYTQLLDDWPKGEDLLRSPKYIFGKDDPIYVQVRNIGTDPDTAETIYSVVSVTSVTGGLAYLTLYETGVDTQIFNNSAFPGELLYLSTENSEGSGDKIKVIDEEVLYFWLKMPPRDEGIYKRSIDVKVDRGEFLAIAGSEMEPGNCVPYFNDSILCEKAILTEGLIDGWTGYEGYKWWENGYMDGKVYSGDDPEPAELAYEQSKNTSFNAGAEDGNSCADSLSLTSHGGMGIVVIESGETTEVTWDPEIDVPSGWSNDAEIIILHGCQSIAWREGEGGPAAPEGNIENIWIGNVSKGVSGDELFSTGIHAVLGYCADVFAITFYNDLYTFWEYCYEGSRVADAWKQACLFGINTPYAVVVRESNLDDYVAPFWSGGQQLTRDSTDLADATTFIYYSYDIGTKVYGPPAGGSYAGSIINRYKRIKTEIDKQIEFKGIYDVDKLAIAGQAEHIRLNMKQQVAHNFDYTSATEFEFLASRRFDKLDSDKHTIEATLDGLKQRLAYVGLSIPPEYVFVSTGQMMARRFGQGEGSGQTWCE